MESICAIFFFWTKLKIFAFLSGKSSKSRANPFYTNTNVTLTERRVHRKCCCCRTSTHGPNDGDDAHHIVACYWQLSAFGSETIKFGLLDGAMAKAVCIFSPLNGERGAAVTRFDRRETKNEADAMHRFVDCMTWREQWGDETSKQKKYPANAINISIQFDFFCFIEKSKYNTTARRRSRSRKLYDDRLGEFGTFHAYQSAHIVIVLRSVRFYIYSRCGYSKLGHIAW